MRVLTMGTFDLLHPGHLALFKWCWKMSGPGSWGAGGTVIATVNSDEFVESYKGRPPVMGEVHRCEMVQAVRWVTDAYIHVHGPLAGPTIEAHRPDVLAIGADWRDRDYLGQLGVTQEWLDERGIVVVYVPLLAGHSSTALRERLGP